MAPVVKEKDAAELRHFWSLKRFECLILSIQFSGLRGSLAAKRVEVFVVLAEE